MLKTNSKQARSNLQAYILDHFTCENYGIEPPSSFAETAQIILDVFRKEKSVDRRGMSEELLFEEWASGLPSILDTCYYYNRSAVDDLGAILEETDAEKARYTESDAEKLLTGLIYRELLRRMKKMRDRKIVLYYLAWSPKSGESTFTNCFDHLEQRERFKKLLGNTAKSIREWENEVTS